ncbi:hypothetical protein BaRGS_00022810 [Batillaria attramentaria]|uniref:GH16 domain-containing protein n=1 Tax=Batillaria attramentaria TaxID=370345 RepID=A0ABD0KFJ0_9CAEN
MVKLAFVLCIAFSVALGRSHKEDDTRDPEDRKAIALTPNSPRFLHRRATTVFYDDFSSGHIDPNKWHFDVGVVGTSPYHMEMWTPDPKNAYVKNGVLYMRPTYTEDYFGNNFLHNGHLDMKATWGFCTYAQACTAHGWNLHEQGHKIRPIMSSTLNTNTKIKYGKVEVVAQLAMGDWLQSAIWMMPSAPYVYGDWPRTGEIDIVEAMGNRHLTDRSGKSRSNDVAFSHLHYGYAPEHHIAPEGEYTLPHAMFGEGFHKWWVDWTERHIIHFPDNVQNVWANGGWNAPFDQPFFLMLDLAVGSTMFWDSFVNHPYPKPWSNQEPEETAMQKFWAARHLWQPTWNGEQAAMKIRSVKMQQY